jgi:hypothetical protein
LTKEPPLPSTPPSRSSNANAQRWASSKGSIGQPNAGRTPELDVRKKRLCTSRNPQMAKPVAVGFARIVTNR